MLKETGKVGQDWTTREEAVTFYIHLESSGVPLLEF